MWWILDKNFGRKYKKSLDWSLKTIDWEIKYIWRTSKRIKW